MASYFFSLNTGNVPFSGRSYPRSTLPIGLSYLSGLTGEEDREALRRIFLRELDILRGILALVHCSYYLTVRTDRP